MEEENENKSRPASAASTLPVPLHSWYLEQAALDKKSSQKNVSSSSTQQQQKKKNPRQVQTFVLEVPYLVFGGQQVGIYLPLHMSVFSCSS